jgi:hypothetical protein
MRPMLVNSRQKIAVLASGLAIATTGFVTDTQAAAQGEAGAPVVSVASVTAPADPLGDSRDSTQEDRGSEARQPAP